MDKQTAQSKALKAKAKGGLIKITEGTGRTYRTTRPAGKSFYNPDTRKWE